MAKCGKMESFPSCARGRFSSSLVVATPVCADTPLKFVSSDRLPWLTGLRNRYLNGGRAGTRTPDLLRVKQAL